MKNNTLLWILVLTILVMTIFSLCDTDRDGYAHRPSLGDYLPTVGQYPQQGGYADTGDAVLQTPTQLKASLCEECTSHCIGQKALQVGTGGVRKDRIACEKECASECHGVL